MFIGLHRFEIMQQTERFSSLPLFLRFFGGLPRFLWQTACKEREKMVYYTRPAKAASLVAAFRKVVFAEGWERSPLCLLLQNTVCREKRIDLLQFFEKLDPDSGPTGRIMGK